MELRVLIDKIIQCAIAPYDPCFGEVSPVLRPLRGEERVFEVFLPQQKRHRAGYSQGFCVKRIDDNSNIAGNGDHWIV